MTATETLRREHRHILRALACAEIVARRLRAGESPPLGDLRELTRFFADYADGCHHAKEEAHLFPALEEHGVSREGGPLAVMLAEHDEGRECVREMREAVEGGEPSDDQLGAWASAAIHFASLLRDHIGKEDHVLFRLAEDLLPPEAMARLGDTFAKVEALEIGRAVQDELEAMAARLADAYEVPEQSNEENRPRCGAL